MGPPPFAEAALKSPLGAAPKLVGAGHTDGGGGGGAAASKNKALDLGGALTGVDARLGDLAEPKSPPVAELVPNAWVAPKDAGAGPVAANLFLGCDTDGLAGDPKKFDWTVFEASEYECTGFSDCRAGVEATVSLEKS